MEISYLTRHYFYFLTYELFENNKVYFSIGKNERDKIGKCYFDSAVILEGLETDLDNGDSASFYEKFTSNLNKLNKDTSDLSFYLYQHFIPYLIIDENETYRKLLDKLIQNIIQFQDKVFNQCKITFDQNKLAYSNYKRVFLSYSYKDKGLTLALFYLCIQNKIFLYVDWMWNNKKQSGASAKQSIEKEMKRCHQFLFLRTSQSELSLNRMPFVRQWCAWEIGNFYTKNKDEKYMLSLYNHKFTNSFLDSLIPFHGIALGKIY